VARLLIILGHPDPAGGHLCHALADAYAQGATQAGHAVTRIDVASLDFPWLQTKEAFETGQLPDALRPAQEAIGQADHLCIVYPLWHGTFPAVLKAFLEQVFRPGFAYVLGGRSWRTRLRGRSARIVVTMGMPVLIYRWYFGAHGLKGFKRSILGFCGIGPIRESLFGTIETASATKRAGWLETMRRLGAQAR
jgi:putative NADPH-quinone reductase